MKKVGFLIFCLFAMCSMAGKAQDVVADSTGYIVKVGEMAPDFTVKLTDGKSITLSELRGKVVMLQFTASWCGVCRKEMPFIEKDIWLKHKSNPDFMLIGIDRDEPLEKVIAFGKSTGVTYPLGLQKNMWASPMCGAAPIPTLPLIAAASSAMSTINAAGTSGGWEPKGSTTFPPGQITPSPAIWFSSREPMTPRAFPIAASMWGMAGCSIAAIPSVTPI